MKCIGSIDEVPISVPSDADLSFFNSPYTGHRNKAALDIYPSHGKWLGPALSPIEGKVTEIQKTRMGREKSFDTMDYDYAIGISPYSHPDKVVRILHCEPSMKLGQHLEIGDEIGSLIRSRYFNYWTSPHYHIEMMSAKDFRRSTRSFRFDFEYICTHEKKENVGEMIPHADWRIKLVTPEYVLLSSSNVESISIGDYIGHSICIDSECGIVDAGIPHYSYGGVHGIDASIGNSIHLGAIPIGKVIGNRNKTLFLRQIRKLKITINGISVRGFSTYLYSRNTSSVPNLKVLPTSYGIAEQQFNEGDVAIIELSL